MRRNIVFNSLILNRVLWVFIVLISGSNSIFANDPFIILGCDSVQFTADSTADHLVINENYYLDNLQA